MFAAQAATPGSHLLRESAAAPLAALLARHRLQRRSFVADRGRSPALVARRVAVSASVVDLEDNDYVPTVDISLARIKQGKRVGSGSFGEVFRGDLLSKDGEEQEESVVLKKKKARSLCCGTRTLLTHSWRTRLASTRVASSGPRRASGGACAAVRGWRHSLESQARTSTWCGATWD